MSKNSISTNNAPPPAGTYSQAVFAERPLLFISGQTPRSRDGKRLVGASVAQQTRQTLDNLAAIAEAAGLSLDDAVKITVYLKDYVAKPDFERIYCKYFSEQPPARIVVQSSFIDFDVEIDAILQKRCEACL